MLVFKHFSKCSVPLIIGVYEPRTPAVNSFLDLMFYYSIPKIEYNKTKGQPYKTFYGRNFRNKLECLIQASLSSLVKHFQVLHSRVGSWPYPQTLN